MQAKRRKGNRRGQDETNREGSDAGLPINLMVSLETLSSMDLSGIRVHRNSSKPEKLDALAYTQGQDIYLGPGQDSHIPHEGWHAVQQMQGRVKPTIQAKGVSINDNADLEREADVMGARASRNMEGNRTDSYKPDQTMATSLSRRSARPVIQRAMKFEYQIKKGDYTNLLYRDDGTNVRPLPRKYGPEDYLVKGTSGVRLESETHGQPEFETGWTRSWSKLREQIDEARQMTDQMNAAPKVEGSDKQEYSEFPFSESQIKHLRPGQGFRMAGGLWTKEQKARKVRVEAEYTDVMSRRSWGSRKIAQLPRGEAVEVLATKGRWSRIEKGDITGWVYNRHLRRTKWFESNKDESGARSDKPLQPDKKLLVKIVDRSWTAYIQTSESFSLDQFESFLKQFGSPSDVDPVISDVSRATSGVDLPTQSGGLKNLLLMVVYYIQMGRKQEPLPIDPKKAYSAKWAYPLMSRTHFGSIFKSLSEAEQELFKKMVNDPVNGIAASQRLKPGDRMLRYGHVRSKDGKPKPKVANPTVQEWLIGITEGKDPFSVKEEFDLPAAMGRFRVEEEFGKQEGLIRFEARRTAGNSEVASKWVEHAHNLFLKASRSRSRDSGKGMTGLKYDVPPPKLDLVPKLTLELGDKTQPGLGLEFRYLFPSLLDGKLKPFVYAGIDTGGAISGGAGVSADPLTNMSLFLAGKGGLRTDLFRSIEIGGELEVGWVFDEYRALRLGIGVGAWQSLSDDQKRAHLNVFFGKRF